MGHRQGRTSARGRRLCFAGLVSLTVVALLFMLIATLARGGFGAIDLVLTLCFLITLPWTVVGFWNALIGLILMRVHVDPARAVCPVAVRADDDSPVTDSTAILMCIRNEDPQEVAHKLNIMVHGLVNAGQANRFHAYILSDSSAGETAEEEARVFGALQERWRGVFPLTYRRRKTNVGYKAGNIRDFCALWGDRHDYALVLDADSFMSTATILRMVRTLQKNPRLGILQSLVVGMPTVSPFARIFQFGMRLGMRSYTLGSAWWQADCGPYWGHNALIRLRPFIRHCHLPDLPGGPPLGGAILSHDQLEAVLMRKAGYEVRVLPEESGSWEENPPTLPEYIRRDLRWCHGNMQYLRLLAMPGLKPVSRVQLLLAILMYLGSPAWLAFMTLGMLRIGQTETMSQAFDTEIDWFLFASIMIMVFAPKLATLAEILASARSRGMFGGTLAVSLSTLGEIVFSVLLAPVVAVVHTRFLLGLPLGRAAVWAAQHRATHRVSVAQAWTRLAPPTLFGLAIAAWLLYMSPAALLAFTPFLLGLMLAVPLAVATSWEGLGHVLIRTGLWLIPDEIRPAAELKPLRLPALQRTRRRLGTSSTALNATASE